jgi:hypothetical protein
LKIIQYNKNHVILEVYLEAYVPLLGGGVTQEVTDLSLLLVEFVEVEDQCFH